MVTGIGLAWLSATTVFGGTLLEQQTAEFKLHGCHSAEQSSPGPLQQDI